MEYYAIDEKKNHSISTINVNTFLQSVYLLKRLDTEPEWNILFQGTKQRYLSLRGNQTQSLKSVYIKAA